MPWMLLRPQEKPLTGNLLRSDLLFPQKGIHSSCHQRDIWCFLLQAVRSISTAQGSTLSTLAVSGASKVAQLFTRPSEEADQH